MTYICPQCGSKEVNRERFTLPHGKAHEFYCNSCRLLESAFKDQDDIDRLHRRWTPPSDSKPSEPAN